MSHRFSLRFTTSAEVYRSQSYTHSFLNKSSGTVVSISIRTRNLCFALLQNFGGAPVHSHTQQAMLQCRRCCVYNKFSEKRNTMGYSGWSQQFQCDILNFYTFILAAKLWIFIINYFNGHLLSSEQYIQSTPAPCILNWNSSCDIWYS